VALQEPGIVADGAGLVPTPARLQKALHGLVVGLVAFFGLVNSQLPLSEDFTGFGAGIGEFDDPHLPELHAGAVGAVDQDEGHRRGFHPDAEALEGLVKVRYLFAGHRLEVPDGKVGEGHHRHVRIPC
jgi:hypothetical protein